MPPKKKNRSVGAASEQGQVNGLFDALFSKGVLHNSEVRISILMAEKESSVYGRNPYIWPCRSTRPEPAGSGAPSRPVGLR